MEKKKFKVHYRRVEPNGDICEFFIAEFDTKQQANQYIRNANKTKLPNETYTLK